MIGKISIILLALFACQGNCLTEIQLEDRHLYYIIHTHFSTAISIPKNFWDTLSTCHVIFPNGVMFEAYPQYQITNQNVFFLEAVQPFTSCGIGFRNIDTSFSGTYELLSTVLHSADNSVSLTRQRFHLTVTESDFTMKEE
ncbi:unnamed protein product, partial [Brenthis ino]